MPEDTPQPVLAESRERRLSLPTSGPVVTLQDLRRLLRAAEEAGLSDTAELDLEAAANGGLLLLEQQQDRRTLTLPQPAGYTVRVRTGPEPKSALQIADELAGHGRRRRPAE